MKSTQLNLIAKTKNSAGKLGKRKGPREISTRNPMHLIFRSSRAVNGFSFLHARNRTRLHQVIQAVAAKHGIRILSCELNTNHAHLLIQGKSRRLLQAFFRHLPQAVMFLVTGAKKGSPKGKFFDSPIFTRIVYWGRDYRQTRDYLWKNLMEAMGLPPQEIAEWREGWSAMRRKIADQLARGQKKIPDPSPGNLELFS